MCTIALKIKNNTLILSRFQLKQQIKKYNDIVKRHDKNTDYYLVFLALQETILLTIRIIAWQKSKQSEANILPILHFKK